MIDEIDKHPDRSRSGKINRAISKATNLSEQEWLELNDELYHFKMNFLSKTNPHVPSAMQITIDYELKEDLKLIEENIIRALGLKVLHTQYVIQLLFYFYYKDLKKEVLSVSDNTNSKTSNISGPEMVKRLVQILLLNRERDQAIIKK